MAARAGMAIFFALSGFLITEALLSGQTVRTFLLRRAGRILPLAYAYLLIAAFLALPEIKIALENFLFLENYTYAWLLNNHFWSLCVEMHFYVAIAVVAAVGGPRLIIVVLPIACLCVTSLRIWHGSYIDIQTHLRVDEICAGGVVAILHRKCLTPTESNVWIFAAASFFLVLCSHPALGALQYLRPYASAALLATTISLGPGVVRSILVSRMAAYIAKISYALYVIHLPFGSGYMAEGSTAIKYLVKRPISILVTLLCAHLSTFYYEARVIAAAKRSSSYSTQPSIPDEAPDAAQNPA